MNQNCNVSRQVPKLSARRSGIIVAIALPLLALHFYAPSQRGLWVETIFEFMHVPVFGVVAIGLFALLGGHFQLSVKTAIVVGAIFLFGVMSEAAQIPTARDASIEDLLRDMAGGIAGLIGCIAFAKELRREMVIRVVLLVVAILVLIPAIAPLASVALAYKERHDQLPVLISGNQRNAMKFVRHQDAETASIVAGTLGESCILTNAGNGRGPGLAFQDLWPNWNMHSYISIMLDNMSGTPLQIVVRIHDVEHRSGNQPHNDRYNHQFELGAGLNTLTIALSDVAAAPSDRTLDVMSIDGVGIFSNDNREDAGFCVYEIRMTD